MGSRKSPRTLAFLLLLLPLWGSTPIPPPSSLAVEELLLAVSPGFVLESVEPESALEKAGMRVGDIVLAWKPFATSTEPSALSHEIRSSFDWRWLETEQACKGRVQLLIVRKGEMQAVPIGPGPWRAKIRLRLPKREEEIHALAQSLYQEGRWEEAAGLWHQLEEASLRQIHIAIWASLVEGQAWAKAGNIQKSQESFQTALLYSAT